MRDEFTVDKNEAGATLAAFLKARLAVTWSKARALVERGKVTVDGTPVTEPAERVRAGAVVKVDEAAPTPSPPIGKTGTDARDPRDRIAFEDPHVVIVDKPAGISSVPWDKRETGTAMDLVREAWRRSGRRATEVPLHVVHRIDKETSGLLCFAKTKLAERALEALFRAHDVDRMYLCVAHGRVRDRRIESLLVPDRGDGLRGSSRNGRSGKRAVTHVRAREAIGELATLCEVRLETGKTHQIRIHLSEAGHPLVGEKVYIRDYERRGGEPLPSARLLLHAATLGFAHPVTGARVQLEAPLPPDFSAELERLRRRAKRP
jgi:23S rRNA pseudouridine1911/1915/1917 synthase